MMGINELTSRASANNQNKMLVSTLEDSITRDEPTDIVKEFTL